MSLSDYIKLVRFKNHPTFLAVVIVVLLLSDNISTSLVISLALLYVSFVALLYGGLYTINDVADINADRLHPLKKKRPLPMAKVSVASALRFAFVLIALGLISGFLLFGKTILLIYLAFVFINLAYSFFMKKVPYVEIIGNTITHPLRLVLAFAFIHQPVPYNLVIAYFFMILGFASLRRVIEKDIRGWESRNVLRAYVSKNLYVIQIFSFSAIIGIALLERPKYGLLYLLMLLIYVFLLFGAYVAPVVRRFWRVLFTS